MGGSKSNYPSRNRRPATSQGRKRERNDSLDLDDSAYNLSEKGGILSTIGMPTFDNDSPIRVSEKDYAPQNSKKRAPGHQKRNGNNTTRQGNGGNRKFTGSKPLANALNDLSVVTKSGRQNRKHGACNSAGIFAVRAPPSIPKNRDLLARLAIDHNKKKSPPKSNIPASWHLENSIHKKEYPTQEEDCVTDLTGDGKEVHRKVQGGKDNRKKPPTTNNSHAENSSRPSHRTNKAQRTSDTNARQSNSDGNYMSKMQEDTNARRSEYLQRRQKAQQQVVIVDDKQDNRNRTQARQQQYPSQKPAARATTKSIESSSRTWFDIDEDDLPGNTGSGTTAGTKNAKGVKGKQSKNPELPEIKSHKRKQPSYANNTTEGVFEQAIPKKSNNGRHQPLNLIASAVRTSESVQGNYFNGNRSVNTDNQIKPQLGFRKVNGLSPKKKLKGNQIIPGAGFNRETMEFVSRRNSARPSASTPAPRENASTRQFQSTPNSFEHAPTRQPSTPVCRENAPTRQSQSTPRRRSKRNKKDEEKKEEVIDLLSDDDDDDEEGDTGVSSSQQVSNTNSPTTASQAQDLHLDVSRIAIGKKVCTLKCKIVVEGEMMKLFGSERRRGRPKLLATIGLAAGFKSFKYCHQVDDGAEAPCWRFMSLQVRPDNANGLDKYTSAYQIDADDAIRKYIVVEFSADTDLQQLLGLFKVMRSCEPYAAEDCALSSEDADAYCKALVVGKRRHESVRVTDSFVGGRPEDTVLLVYPFDGDVAAMEGAAEGMQEASGALFSKINAEDAPTGRVVADDSSSESPVGNDTGTAKARADQRKHFCTIQVRDFERLCPGEFLNDSLIDFWMQWITRKSNPGDNSVHCFSSHFFTSLFEDGAQGVEKWTAKKGINIFDKKFIFIPINDALHWSLCVVVNPGNIKAQEEDRPMACMLFLDSLQAHRKKKFSKKVRDWLNSEWKRINKDTSDPFERNDIFPLLNPRIPYQDNTWDCGVFVCRYAYSLYSMRDVPFLFNDQWFATDLIQAREEFQFDMPDIARLREDIRKLVQGLSNLYLPWKEKNNRALKEERRKEKILERRKRLEAPGEKSADTSRKTAVDGKSAGLATAPDDSSNNNDDDDDDVNNSADASIVGRSKSGLHQQEASPALTNTPREVDTVASEGNLNGGKDSGDSMEDGSSDESSTSQADHTGHENTGSEEGTEESGKENEIVPSMAVATRSPYRSPGKVGRSPADDQGSLSKPDEVAIEI